jgi:hypothetical protein
VKGDSVPNLDRKHSVRVIQHRDDAHHADDDLVSPKTRNVCVQTSDSAIERGSARAKKRVLVPARKLGRERANVFAP